MLQAITTKYLSPTNTRGTRVKATAAAGSSCARSAALLVCSDSAKAGFTRCCGSCWN